MGEIRALFYDGRTAVAHPVAIRVLRHDGGPCIELLAGDAALEFPLSRVTVEMRVGRVPRVVRLPDGGSLEILDNDAFDTALAAFGRGRAEQRLGLIERHSRTAAAAVLFVVLGGALFFFVGLPALAGRAVALFPESVDVTIGDQGLELLDRGVFRPTTLAAERQLELDDLFRGMLAGEPDAARYRLELRGGGRIGANAIALPSGIVVLTDELAYLAVDDNELKAVLAHEIGHVKRRHAMRMLLQSSTTALVMATLFGDASNASALIVAVPTVLTHARYSRDFEREADAFSYAWLAAHGIADHYLGDLLERLVAKHGGESSGLLSSHPSLAERVRHARPARTVPTHA